MHGFFDFKTYSFDHIAYKNLIRRTEIVILYTYLISFDNFFQTMPYFAIVWSVLIFYLPIFKWQVSKMFLFYWKPKNSH